MPTTTTLIRAEGAAAGERLTILVARRGTDLRSELTEPTETKTVLPTALVSIPTAVAVMLMMLLKRTVPDEVPSEVGRAVATPEDEVTTVPYLHNRPAS